ncbi:MAG: ABC transporter substrate-binding protein [Rhodospirillales bacterium]|nr:ABC transporter substrate-binding protein [Rhodospirillales bacterium]
MAAFAVLCIAMLVCAPARAQVGVGLTPPPLEIAVFVSSRRDVCYDPGDAAAIERLTIAEQNRINASGGILDRQVRVRILDDHRTPARTTANLKEALANPNTVAMVGLAYSDGATAAFKELGAEIDAKAIPFLSDITIASLLENSASVFTMRPSQDDERLPVMSAFMKSSKVERPAFIGLRDQRFSASLGDGLRDAGGITLAVDHRLTLIDNKLDPAVIPQVIADLKEKNVDLAVISVGSQRIAPLLAAMAAAGVTPPILVTGRIETLVENGEYAGDIYQLAWDDLPHVFSDRLRQRVIRNGLDNWVFGGTKNAEAPGWSNGSCKERSAAKRDIFDSRNMRAIGRGTQYADMIGLVAEALRAADPKDDVGKLRAHLLKTLTTSYAAGRGAYRGSFENWSFRPFSRTADRTPFIIMRPRGLGSSQLAPVQFARLKADKLRPVDTLYIDIDLIRIARVDENDKSFFAEFFMSMRGAKVSIDHVDFSNSFIDPKTNDRQISYRTLHDGSASELYPDQMKIYRVSGRFTFEPRLANYPFDTQRFAIDVQPKSGNSLFIVQPPPASMRDKDVGADGWDPQEQYVGYDEDFMPTIDAWTLSQSTVPFYKASFAWLMKRQTTDYYLRVVVPLAFILIVAYLSIFIPQTHFEAIVTIQVTALLSAVALYLALPKIDADGTTVSDRLFLFMYMAVSLMVALSIFRITGPVARRPWLGKIIAALYVIVIPILVTGMGLYLYRASLGQI